jgi:hypothetical protein
MQLEFSRQIFQQKKYLKISYLIKIRPEGAELFQTDRHDEANSPSTQYYEHAYQHNDNIPIGLT